MAFLFTGGKKMKLESLVRRIESLFPLEWAESWDRPGLLVGDPSSEIGKISFSLDATLDSVKAAAANGSNLLITHHPAFFRPLERVTPETMEGAVVFEAIRNGISLYGIHTNWDVSPYGVNVTLAEKAGLSGIAPIVEAKTGSWGLGALGELEQEVPLCRLAHEVREAWGLTWIRVHGNPGRIVRKIALCGGSGGDFLQEAAKRGAEAFITADLRYHQENEGAFSGISILACDHGEMESVSLERLAELIISGTGLRAEQVKRVGATAFFDLETPRFPKE